MPRLFTGLEIPPLVTEQLTMLQGGLPQVRWIEPEDFHITLRFIGDIDNAMAQEVAFGLDRIAHGPLSLRLEGLGAFGGETPRSLHMRIAPTPELRALQAAHERLMQRLGLKAERRSFLPHITLARCRGLPPGAAAHWLAQRGGVMQVQFEVEHFVLYSARDSVGGGPYVVEEAYPLIPPLSPPDTVSQNA